MKHMLVATALLGLVACHGKAAETTPPTEAKPVVAGGSKVGIPACDLWVEKFTQCIEKAPASARTQMREAMNQTTAFWAQTATTPEGKDALEKTCEKMIVSTREETKELGCEW
jgi:hypothetical protein